MAKKILVILVITVMLSACTPEIVAKDAIKKWFGKYSDCAERIVERESAFQSDAVNSRSGAIGLFQLLPLHKTWIKSELGYEFIEMKDPYKNAEAAQMLARKNQKAYKDQWAPWRLHGGPVPYGPCPA